ncbi:MAG: hypothetical protein ACLUQ6_13745 [Alistipes onderdonkii]
MTTLRLLPNNCLGSVTMKSSTTRPLRSGIDRIFATTVTCSI